MKLSSFARAQPGIGLRILLLDFGAARKLDSSIWGAVDFSNTRFSNAEIVAALERAADGYHNCHVRGGVEIVYGNSNYHLSSSGMSTTDAWWAGYHQAERAEQLSDYQAANGYDSQTADAADFNPEVGSACACWYMDCPTRLKTPITFSDAAFRLSAVAA